MENDNKIVKMYQDRLSTKKISELTGLHKASVSRILKRNNVQLFQTKGFIPVTHWKCSACKITKEIHHFSAHATTRTKHSYECKECKREYFS